MHCMTYVLSLIPAMFQCCIPFHLCAEAEEINLKWGGGEPLVLYKSGGGAQYKKLKKLGGGGFPPPMLHIPVYKCSRNTVTGT